jgi:hypothetical protein
MSAPEPIMQARGLVKRFGQVTALAALTSTSTPARCSR